MARKQPQIEHDGIIDIDPTTGRAEFESTDENLQSDQDAQLDSIIGEFEASDDNVTFRASINKVPDNYKKGGKEEWCADIDSSQIAGVRMFLRERFGSGIYRIRVFRNNKQVRQFDYHIAKPLINPTAPLNADNPALQAITDQMRQQNEQIQRLTERLLSGPQNAPVAAGDPFMMMERMSTIMKNMQPALAPPQAETSLDTFMKAAEFAREMMPQNGGGDDGWSGIAKALITSPQAGEIIQTIMNARRPMQQRGQGRQLQHQPQMQNQQPQNTQQHEIPAEVSGTDPQALGNQLQSNMRYLIGKAERNADPGLYAEWLLDNTDQNIILPMINDPNLLNQLSGAFPRLAMFRPWFEELVSAAKQLISEMDQGDGQPHEHFNPSAEHTQNGAGGEGGHDSHIEDNGGAGQAV